MANANTFFTLNTGAKIPSIGLGTYKATPGVVGDAISVAVQVSLSLSVIFLLLAVLKLVGIATGYSLIMIGRLFVSFDAFTTHASRS